MALCYRLVDRDQQFLMPPNLRDWLPEGHLVWFVLDVVERVDTSVLHARHPNDGPGRPAYDPEMLLALLLYAYCTGVRSSRQIERLCGVDVAYRVVCANQAPDHTTIARFRQDHDEVAQSLFVDVLELCAAAGLTAVGVVAVDGTKVGADASKAANHTGDQIRARVREMFAEAQRRDATEDTLFGEARGDELPPELVRRADRLRRLDAALGQVEAQRAAAWEAARQAQARRAAKAEAAAREGRRLGGRKPKGADPVAEAEAALGAARARAEARRARRAAKEQAAAEQGRRVRGPKPSPPDDEVAEAETRLREAREQAAAAPSPEPAAEPRANTTDPDSRLMKTRDGFIQGYNAQAAVNEHGIVLAGQVTQDHNDVAQCQPMTAATQANLAAAGVNEPIGTMLFDAGYWSDDNATAPGPDRLIATTKSWKLRRKTREAGHTTGPTPEGVSPAQAMEHRLCTADGDALYAKRGTTVEPVFGQHKEARGYRRFMRRGLQAAQAEWNLINTTHNIRKLFASQPQV